VYQKRPILRFLVSAGALCASVGCDAVGPEEERAYAVCRFDEPARSLSQSARESLPPSPAATVNTQWAALARVVPGGWGGYFLERGSPYIYLVDPSQVGVAVPALQAGGIPVTPGVGVKQGRWDFAQLFDWNAYIVHRMGRESFAGVNAVDLDEARNRIMYGVPDDGMRTRLEGFLDGLDLPCDLIRIELVGPVVSD
jgi:hypothetical protein